MNAVVNMHRYPTLEDDYANAWSEWDMTGEAEVWDETTGDSLANAAR